MPRRSPSFTFQGEQAECAFIHAAMQRGLVAAIPLTNSAGYDVIVDTGRPFDPRYRGPRRLWRVQVKCALYAANHKLKVHAWRSAGRFLLSPRDADFLAAYVPSCGLWYIIPVTAITSASIYLHPHRKNSRGRFERFRERWDLFHDARPLTSKPRRHKQK